MSIETSISKNRYLGDGLTMTYAFTFKAWKTEQVRVIVGDGTTEEDVTTRCVIALNDDAGGTVTFATAPEKGSIIIVMRAMPFLQEDRYVTGSRFDPHEIEDALDMACAERQELKEQLDRSVKLPPTSLVEPDELIAEVMQAKADARDAAAAAEASKEGAAAILAETTQAGEDAAAEVRQEGEAQIALLKEISTAAGDRAEGFAAAAEQSASMAGASEDAAAESARQAAISASETGMPIGMVLPYTGRDVPTGMLRADGTIYSNMAKSFPYFYEWVVSSGLVVDLEDYTLVEGSCGYYGLDESTGTVRMPTLAAGVFGTTTASKYGQAVEAGLPNITGVASARDSAINEAVSGAFYEGPTRAGFWFYQDGSSPSECFDASRSNAIYGKSDTVTPSHVKYPWVIVVYNSAVPPSVAQTAELINLLEQKTDKAEFEAFRNSVRAYVTDTWQSDMLWYRKWNDGWIEQGGIVGSLSNGSKSISFPLEFSNTIYTFLAFPRGYSHGGDFNIGTADHSTTGVRANWDGQDSDPGYIDWYACGY